MCPRSGVKALQPRGLAIQTWITAGPDLPPLPDNGTPEENAAAQAANDARLQPGHTWHAVILTRHTDDLPTAIRTVLRDQLLPALTHKPRHVLTITYGPEPKPKPKPAKTTTTKRRTTTKRETRP